MRNLKKVLSLALALVMLLGMMVVGAGAAGTEFSDDADIKNKEAVAVLSAINVLNGKDNGQFDPKGTLKRSEGAKIIATMLIGSAADKLAQTNTAFTDVPQSHWASGCINFCQQQGLISGVGGGLFDPDAELTGTQFAKMLLCALGYDEAIEKFTGSAWANNVANRAHAAGLDNELTTTLVVAQSINRDQAAQMAFNALTADMVEYPNRIDIGTSDGTNIVAGTQSSAVANRTGKDYADRNDTDMQFCELYYQDLKLQNTGAQTDELGRLQSVWTMDDEPIVSVNALVPVVTYTKDMNTTAGKRTIASDLKGYKLDNGKDLFDIENSSNRDWNIGYIEKNTWEEGTLVDKDNPAATLVEQIAALTANGVVVEIYANRDNKYIQNSFGIVRIEKTFATVTGDPTTRDNKGVDQVRIPGVRGWTNAEFVIGWEDLAKDDVVLVAEGKSDFISGQTAYVLEKCETVTGVVSGTQGTKLRVDGTYYDVSKLDGASTGWAANDFKNEYTFYLDDGGFIVAGKTDGETSAPTQYAVVETTGYYNGGSLSVGAHGEAKLIFSDGASEIVTVSTVDGNNADGDNGKIKGLADDTLVSYTVSGGKYALTKVNPVNIASGTIIRGNATVKGEKDSKATVNAATSFLIRSGKAGEYKYTSYSGNDKVPSMTGVTAKVVNRSNNIAELVYVTGGESSGIDSASYVYIPLNMDSEDQNVTYSSVTKEDGSGVAYYTISAYVDGELDEEYKVASNQDQIDTSVSLARGVVYRVLTTDADTEAATKFEQVSMTTGVSLSGKTLVTGDTAVPTNDETVIFRITEDQNIDTIAWDGSFSDKTDKVYVQTGTNGMAKVVYIKEVAERSADVSKVEYKIGSGEAVEVSGGNTGTGTKEDPRIYSAKGNADKAGETVSVTLTASSAEAKVERVSVTPAGAALKTAAAGEMMGDKASGVTLLYRVTSEDGDNVSYYQINLQITTKTATGG